MAKRMLSLVVGAAILAAVIPLSITVSAAEMTCRVPFSFVVDGKTLPAGRYAINTNGNVVLLTGVQKGAIVMTTPADRISDHGRGKLVFLRIGDRYDLVEIWTSDDLKREVPKVRKQVEERARAANRSVERIVVPGA